MTYHAFGKIPRWNREIVLTEKIDGTNGLVAIREARDEWPTGRTRPPRTALLPNGTEVAAGSRKRWITPEGDNHGFARWVWDNAEELATLGSGLHYGEWYGKGVNRGYGLSEKRFMLFNVAKWGDESESVRPKCCEVATVLSRCLADDLVDVLSANLATMEMFGSAHVPGYQRPEGVVVYHTAGNHLYKVTFEGDEAKSATPVKTKGDKAMVDAPIDPKEITRQVLQEWTNKDFDATFGTEKFETKVPKPADVQPKFPVVAKATGTVKEKVAA